MKQGLGSFSAKGTVEALTQCVRGQYGGSAGGTGVPGSPRRGRRRQATADLLLGSIKTFASFARFFYFFNSCLTTVSESLLKHDVLNEPFMPRSLQCHWQGSECPSPHS